MVLRPMPSFCAASIRLPRVLSKAVWISFDSKRRVRTSHTSLRPAASYAPRLGLDRAEGGPFTLGAFRGAVLVGAIGCERDARAKVRHIGHHVGMMVRADQQRRGLGRALLDAALAEARRADGLVLLTLSVTADNQAAIRLYERFGFVRCGSLPRAIRVDGGYHAKDQMVRLL